MLFVETFTFNPFSENTYIVYNEVGRAIIVDPGMFNPFECRQIDTFISHKNLVPIAIVNTHTHIDHILGVDYMKEKYSIPFYIHKDDQVILDNAQESGKRFGFDFGKIPTVDGYLEDKFVLGEEELSIYHTPGHSPGSVALYYPNGNWVISGDVLFNQSIGRTDLPFGDFKILKASILHVMYELPEETTVYSGHGPITTIKDEKYSNPFVRL